MPEITVFMAAYNTERYIGEAVESILNQSFEDFELLIVNDGSTDRTREVVLQFTDSRIKLIDNPSNMGLTYTRNVALTEARGNYIAVLDSDDIALPNRLKRQYDEMQSRPELALLGSQSFIIDSQGKLEDENLNIKVGAELVKVTLLFNNTYVNSSVMFKTDVFRELKGYREFAPVEDYEFFLRISDRYAVDNLDEHLVKYRRHDHNISKLKVEKALSLLKDIKEQQLEKLLVNPDKKMAAILFWPDPEIHSLDEVLQMFILLKEANEQKKVYDDEIFANILFSKWFDFFYSRRRKRGTLPLLFNRKLFRISCFNTDMIRKVLRTVIHN
ncbi:Glycosyl transferase family 2 [bacterium A37T11]|nr:Glycosyl transferase family 2 [bacterium A37T11]